MNIGILQVLFFPPFHVGDHAISSFSLFTSIVFSLNSEETFALIQHPIWAHFLESLGRCAIGVV